VKVIDVLRRANRFYPDGQLDEYFTGTGEFIDNPNGGDSCARAVVIGLTEDDAVSDEDAGDLAQIAGAKMVIVRMIQDLCSVLAGLDDFYHYGEGYTRNEQEG